MPRSCTSSCAELPFDRESDAHRIAKPELERIGEQVFDYFLNSEPIPDPCNPVMDVELERAAPALN